MYWSSTYVCSTGQNFFNLILARHRFIFVASTYDIRNLREKLAYVEYSDICQHDFIIRSDKNLVRRNEGISSQ